MNDFWKSDSKKFDLEKTFTKPLKFEEFDFDALLSKYGPDGLYELGDILQGIALKDAEFARQMDTDVEDDCYR